MPSRSVWKFTCLSAIFAATSNAQGLTISKAFLSPSATLAREPTIPEPTGKWISPEYKWFFEYPLPLPPQKTSRLSYTNKVTHGTIDYYEIELKPFAKQIYPNLAPTNLVGYDGISPGPQFIMQKGRGMSMS
jgi:bilirubin oxidase